MLFNKLKPKFKLLDYIVKIFLITILLLLILEFVSYLTLSIHTAINGAPVFQLLENREVFSNKDWTRIYFAEHSKIENQYSPYVGFTSKPLTGKYLNIDSDSIRKTHNPCKNKNSIKIFMFGGSTLFGDGNRDNNTIPSYLSRKLCKNDIPVEIVNFGQLGYTNTQEMMRLILELRLGNIPDYVIFYDGINEVYSSLQNNMAGLPINIEHRKIEFNSRHVFNLIRPLTQTNFMKIMNTPTGKKFLPKKGKEDFSHINFTSLAYEIVDTYVQNKKIVDSLSTEYNFTVFYFWQPVLYTKKELSEEEKVLLSNYVAKNSLVKVTYKLMESFKSDRFYDLTDIFDDTNHSIYYDNDHIGDEGNKIVAKNMASLIIRDINK